MKKDKTTAAELRESFDALSLDDKATFLVQATFSTAAATIDEIGTRISELVDALASEPHAEEEEPTTATKTARKATRASTKSRKTTTRKKTKPDSDKDAS